MTTETDEMPQPPQEPEQGACCGSGCIPCVYDRYWEELDEYERALDDIGLTLDELWTIDRRALDHAFADPATLDRLRTEFDAWAATA